MVRLTNVTLDILFILGVALLVTPARSAQGQNDLTPNEGITSPVHRSHLGTIVFTRTPAGNENLTETDFLKRFSLNQTGDLAMKVFMANSLTNYLHRLAPDLSVDELTRNGNYQFSFFVDGRLIHKENFNPAWLGSPESKNAKTVY